jgi:cytochrome b561
MPLKSTHLRYGSIARALHWLTALAIIGLFATGQMLDSDDTTRKLTLLAVHVPLGLSVLVLTLARIAWWGLADTRPASLATGWQDRAARVVHGAFYVLMLGMAISGMALMALSGAGEIVFGGAPGPLPDFHDYLPRIPHGIGSKLLLALVVVHVGAALYHHAIMRDATLQRMAARL